MAIGEAVSASGQGESPDPSACARPHGATFWMPPADQGTGQLVCYGCSVGPGGRAAPAGPEDGKRQVVREASKGAPLAIGEAASDARCQPHAANAQ